jgi:hypothetical protein
LSDTSRSFGISMALRRPAGGSAIASYPGTAWAQLEIDKGPVDASPSITSSSRCLSREIQG